MNTERTITIENIADFPISLFDTQKRIYPLDEKSKIRISEVSLQDILDYRPSKIIFDEGHIKLSNISKEKLLNMGLTEDEVKLYLKEEIKSIAKKEKKENLKEEIKKEIKEEVKAEVKEELKEVKKTTPVKAAAKKSSTKKHTAPKHK